MAYSKVVVLNTVYNFVVEEFFLFEVILSSKYVF
jgi:hypothetical protein